MAASPDDAQIAIDGACALMDFVKMHLKPNKMKDVIIEYGGHAQLLSALEASPGNQELCEKASDVLYLIADGSDYVLPRCSLLVAAGAVPLLAAVVRTHNGYAKFKARNTLKLLGYRGDGKPKVIFTGFPTQHRPPAAFSFQDTKPPTLSRSFLVPKPSPT